MSSDGSSGCVPSTSDMLVKAVRLGKAEKRKIHLASFSLTAAMTLHPGTAECLSCGKEADPSVLCVQRHHGAAVTLLSTQTKATYTVTEICSVQQDLYLNVSVLHHKAYVIPHLVCVCVCVCSACVCAYGELNKDGGWELFSIQRRSCLSK